jgi:hypothetical protein
LWFLGSFYEGSPAMHRFRADPVGNDGPIWTLSGWLFWLDPDERLWRWWDCDVTSVDEFMVKLVVFDWPTPSGALK